MGPNSAPKRASRGSKMGSRERTPAWPHFTSKIKRFPLVLKEKRETWWARRTESAKPVCGILGCIESTYLRIRLLCALSVHGFLAWPLVCLLACFFACLLACLLAYLLAYLLPCWIGFSFEVPLLSYDSGCLVILTIEWVSLLLHVTLMVWFLEYSVSDSFAYCESNNCLVGWAVDRSVVRPVGRSVDSWSVC